MPQSSKRQSIALQNYLFYPSFSGVLFNQLALQKRRFNTLAVTVGFVAFANYGNQVALLRVVNGVMQGIQPVGNFYILGVRVALAIPVLMSAIISSTFSKRLLSSVRMLKSANLAHTSPMP